MPEKIAPPGGDLFPELKDDSQRRFTETGWGRFPIALDDAGLNPISFALYVRISVACDAGTEFDEQKLADRCRISVLAARSAVKDLKQRGMLKIEGETWTLTDPKEWLPL